MALTLAQLVEKYKVGTMTDADLKESGYMMHQVEGYAEALKDGRLGDLVSSSPSATIIGVTKSLESILVSSSPSATVTELLGNGGTVTLTQPTTIYQNS